MASVTTMMRRNVFFLCVFVAVVSVNCYQFEVGEKEGWVKLNGNESQTYNEWAARNRFSIGDTLYFEYKNDSVLLVHSADNEHCNTSNPIAKFEDGHTVFPFKRSGFFYFISGEPGHCKAGQKLIIRVVHPTEAQSPRSAHMPSTGPALVPASASVPGPAGGDSGSGEDKWGPSSSSSSTNVSVASSFMTAFLGLLVLGFLYLFV